MSHDSVNRFLLREQYEPKDLFDELKLFINFKGGTLSGDDSIIDKPYSDPKLTKLIGYYWSGKHHKTVKGICLITLYYTDGEGKSLPINYRLYDKEENKTKNDYLREMISEVLKWVVEPKYITTDAWYASKENLKFFKDKKLGFLVGVAKNRLCSINGEKNTHISKLQIPDEGLIVHLKNFGEVKVFCKNFKNEESRYYIMYSEKKEELLVFNREDFKKLNLIHWGIECYHRAIKQVCGIERFMVRTSEAIKTHFFSAIRAFTQLELMRSEKLINSWYEIQRNLSILFENYKLLVILFLNSLNRR